MDLPYQKKIIKGELAQAEFPVKVPKQVPKQVLQKGKIPPKKTELNHFGLESTDRPHLESFEKEKVIKVIHYSKEKDFTLKPIEIKNGALPVKPHGGLWASPEKSSDSWKQWCENEHFGNIGAQNKVTLEVDTKNFITIDKVDDLDKLPWYNIIAGLEAIDFEKLKKKGIDGILLTEKGQAETRFSRFLAAGIHRDLYGWDCESVLIMNERCIKKIKESGEK